jgi:hypothetical protein
MAWVIASREGFGAELTAYPNLREAITHNKNNLLAVGWNVVPV